MTNFLRFLPPERSTRWLIAAVLALHLALGAALGLSVDEAHYLLYAAHPALSYFDHPPLVGWVQWPLVALDAPTALLRVVPGALWLGTVLGVYRLAQRLVPSDAGDAGAAGGRAGLWAVAALALAWAASARLALLALRTDRRADAVLRQALRQGWRSGGS